MTKKKHHFISIIFAGILLLMSTGKAHSQISDTSIVANSIQRHSPQKALIYSILCPGLGQIYNKKYWKLPLIYGAGGTLLYFIGFNHLKYTKFREAYYLELADPDAAKFARIDGVNIPDYNLERGMNGLHRWRDQCVIGFGAVYLLNVIDAMVDANFFYYDVSDDLSLRVEPGLIDNFGMTASIGFRINLGF